MRPASDQVWDITIPAEALPLIQWGKMERLTCRQAAILVLVRENPGTSPTALAHILEVPKPAVTRAIDKLVSQKMLTRTDCTLDRRVQRVWPVTKKGKKA